MIHHYKGVIGQTHHSGNVARGDFKRMGTQHNRSLAALLKGNAVMQTARRAGPSVSHRRQQEVTVLHQGVDAPISRRSTGVLFNDHLRNATTVFTDEKIRSFEQQNVSIQLVIGQQPYGGALQGRELRRPKIGGRC